MINPFIKFKGLEFFATLEFASGGDEEVLMQRNVNQYVGDIVRRFRGNEKFYVGAHYNVVDGKLKNADANAISINRFETAAGWFMTKNILAKFVYVSQNYKDFSQFVSGIRMTYMAENLTEYCSKL